MCIVSATSPDHNIPSFNCVINMVLPIELFESFTYTVTLLPNMLNFLKNHIDLILEHSIFMF